MYQKLNIPIIKTQNPKAKKSGYGAKISESIGNAFRRLMLILWPAKLSTYFDKAEAAAEVP